MPVETSGIATITVPVERAVDFARGAFVAAGVPEADAGKAAAALIDADLHGVSTHGIKNLSGYVRAVQQGRVKARPEIRVSGGSGALQQMSGGGGLGHVAAHHGMEHAIALAKAHGIGCVFMRESNHYGASGYWARLAVGHGMAGFATTNAGASIAPWGGTHAMVGNNPPAWAVPASNGGNAGDAVFLDMALSVVAGNRLDIYARRGQPIPAGWAFDKDGQPTTDPRARQHGGTFAPIADYKGYGLALMLSLFTSLLAAGPFDFDVNRDDVPNAGRCHWFMAFDIGQLVSPESFTTRVGDISERIRTSPAKAGVDRLYVPGDIERERAQRQLQEGLALEPFIVEDLESLAISLDVPFDL
jgi:LDH2 family malate/lactate/ureidoglycolate dehydrogenase